MCLIIPKYDTVTAFARQSINSFIKIRSLCQQAKAPQWVTIHPPSDLIFLMGNLPSGLLSFTFTIKQYRNFQK